MISSGFFDSLNRDRKYNAIQFGSIFDGIIIDGIFMSVGNCFRVTAGEGMTVVVAPGRAWFKHTWILNDSQYPITLDQSELILNRIDAIVIDVNINQDVRKNTIKVLKGTPAANNPARPALINEYRHQQYPLAYISVRANVIEIRTADITSMVGTSESPYVTGPLQTVNIDALLDQWQDQYLEFYENQTQEILNTNAMWKQQWENFYNAQTTEMTNTNEAWKRQWEAYYNAQTGEVDAAHDQWLAFYNAMTTDMSNTNALWKQQWAQWFTAQTQEIQDAYEAWQSEWELWMRTHEAEMNEVSDQWNDLWNAWFYTYTSQSTAGFESWRNQTQNDILAWWESVKDILDENCCANLASRVVDLESKVSELENNNFEVSMDNREMYDAILGLSYTADIGDIETENSVAITTASGDVLDIIGEETTPILDTEEKKIKGTTKFTTL